MAPRSDRFSTASTVTVWPANWASSASRAPSSTESPYMETRSAGAWAGVRMGVSAGACWAALSHTVSVRSAAATIPVRPCRLLTSSQPVRGGPRPNERGVRESSAARGGETVGEGLGHRPAVGDHRLAVGRISVAHQLHHDLAAGLHRRGVQHQLGCAVGAEPEAAVVVAGITPETTGETPTPGPFLAVGRVLRARAHVVEHAEERVRSRVRDPPRDEDILVGE